LKFTRKPKYSISQIYSGSKYGGGFVLAITTNSNFTQPFWLADYFNWFYLVMYFRTSKQHGVSTSTSAFFGNFHPISQTKVNLFLKKNNNSYSTQSSSFIVVLPLYWANTSWAIAYSIWYKSKPFVFYIQLLLFHLLALALRSFLVVYYFFRNWIKIKSLVFVLLKKWKKRQSIVYKEL